MSRYRFVTACFLVLSSCLYTDFQPKIVIDLDISPEKAKTNHILYLMHTGNISQSLAAYEEYRKENGKHDFELIEALSLVLLDQGFRSKDPETQLMTLFGAGVSANERALYIIEEGVQSREGELQLIALNFLSRYHHDRADLALKHALKSDFLLARLEAIFYLAKNKNPKAVGLIEGLMAKVPEAVWPLFPQLFAISGTPDAKRMLRKLLTHRDEAVRVAAINSVAEYSHEDFIATIRRLASQHGNKQQEASAAALGVLHDEDSVSRLLVIAQNPKSEVRLAALSALYQLGRKNVRESVQEIAKNGNVFAIQLLGKMPGSEHFLSSLLKSDNLQIQINAAAALLELRDPRSLIPLVPVLIRDPRDLALVEMKSPANSLSAFRVIPSAKQNFEDKSVGAEVSLHLRESILAKTVELPEKDFLSLAHTILDVQQNDLVPALMQIMENHATPATIELLKKHQQKAGAPLIRNYCNLALYRLKQPGPYADNLKQWMTQSRNIDLIRFRPLVPWDVRDKSDGGEIAMHKSELTAQETSRLLVEAFEAFVEAQDDKGIDILISVIQTGNSKNKYALIGLLLHAIQ